jgi:hypothetical protein
VPEKTEIIYMNRERAERRDIRDEVFRRSREAGEYLDQFTTVPAEPVEVTLLRLPKCLERKDVAHGPNSQTTS